MASKVQFEMPLEDAILLLDILNKRVDQLSYMSPIPGDRSEEAIAEREELRLQIRRVRFLIQRVKGAE